MMLKKLLKWLKVNKLGLFIGASAGFIVSKIMFEQSSGRQALLDLSKSVGIIDTWLASYSQQTILFIKLTIFLMFIFALIGAFVESQVS